MKRFYFTKNIDQNGIITEVYSTSKEYILGILEAIEEYNINKTVIVECTEVCESEKVLIAKAYKIDRYLDICTTYFLEVNNESYII